MKRITPVLLMLSTLFILPGCAFIYSLDRDLDKQVDIWLKEQEYSKALDALRLVRKSHPKYAVLVKKKSEVIKAANAYEKTKLQEANNFIARQQWHEAEKSLNTSMGKLPDSEKLQASYRDFIKQRAQYLKSLYYQLYINKAEWLVKNQDVNRELARTMPADRDTKNAIAQHQQEVQHVYQQLLVCGIEGMNIDDLDLAEQCFMLADELQPSNELKATIADIQKKMTKLKQQKTVKLSKRGRYLLEKAQQELQAGKLKNARNAYNDIPTADKRHGLVRAYKQEMDNRIESNVSDGIELGRKLYSQGEVEQALAVWHDLRELAPDNEYLISHIDRAERVLKKLNRLRKKDAATIPPS